MRYYFDANVFAYYALREPPYFERCLKILQKVMAREVEGIVSIQTLGEVYNVVRKLKGFEAAEEATQAILSMPVEFMGADPAIFVHSRELARRNLLSIWDAMHLASALRASADVFVTNDADFKKVREIKVEYL